MHSHIGGKISGSIERVLFPLSKEEFQEQKNIAAELAY